MRMEPPCLQKDAVVALPARESFAVEILQERDGVFAREIEELFEL